MKLRAWQFIRRNNYAGFVGRQSALVLRFSSSRPTAKSSASTDQCNCKSTHTARATSASYFVPAGYRLHAVPYEYCTVQNPDQCYEYEYEYPDLHTSRCYRYRY
eukprot:scaffold316136_cov20-Prasinocladus_malaysianus.AAC.1